MIQVNRKLKTPYSEPTEFAVHIKEYGIHVIAGKSDSFEECFSPFRVGSGVKVGSTVRALCYFLSLDVMALVKKKQIKVSVRTALAQDSYMVALDWIDRKKSEYF